MMIQSPFPELKPFETPPRLPSLQNLLAAIPVNQSKNTPSPQRPRQQFPSFPMESATPSPQPARPVVGEPLPQPSPFFIG